MNGRPRGSAAKRSASRTRQHLGPTQAPRALLGHPGRVIHPPLLRTRTEESPRGTGGSEPTQRSWSPHADEGERGPREGQQRSPPIDSKKQRIVKRNAANRVSSAEAMLRDVTLKLVSCGSRLPRIPAAAAQPQI